MHGRQSVPACSDHLDVEFFEIGKDEIHAVDGVADARATHHQHGGVEQRSNFSVRHAGHTAHSGVANTIHQDPFLALYKHETTCGTQKTKVSVRVDTVCALSDRALPGCFCKRTSEILVTAFWMRARRKSTLSALPSITSAVKPSYYTDKQQQQKKVKRESRTEDNARVPSLAAVFALV